MTEDSGEDVNIHRLTVVDYEFLLFADVKDVNKCTFYQRLFTRAISPTDVKWFILHTRHLNTRTRCFLSLNGNISPKFKYMYIKSASMQNTISYLKKSCCFFFLTVHEHTFRRPYCNLRLSLWRFTYITLCTDSFFICWRSILVESVHVFVTREWWCWHQVCFSELLPQFVTLTCLSLWLNQLKTPAVQDNDTAVTSTTTLIFLIRDTSVY